MIACALSKAWKARSVRLRKICASAVAVSLRRFARKTGIDWARLGPNQQRELMNAAQQSGPPGYQSMIKNYYVRIARLGKVVEKK